MFQERIHDKSFRVAVVGEFSSGKSTFINALLGRDILSHAAQETTATVTRIVNVSPEDPRNGTGIVSFRDGSDTLTLSSLDDLKEYTTAESKSYKVVQQIDTVTIYLPIMDSHKEIELIDTPGLNGIAEGHREQTIQLIQKAHACIYLIQRRGISESDLWFLKLLLRYQKNYIFIQNFIDELRETENETPEGKVAEQRDLLQQEVFNDYPEAVFDVCGISALQELAAKDHTIRTLYSDSINELTEEDREELHIRSHFEDFLNVLEEHFQGDHLDEIRYRDTAHALLHWVERLLLRASGRKERAEEAYKMSGQKDAMDVLDKLEEKVRSSQKENEQSLSNLVKAKCDELGKAERNKIATDFVGIQEDVLSLIRKGKTLEDMDRLDKEIPAKMDHDIREMLNEHDLNQKAYLQRLYQLLMDRIKQYSGIQSQGLNVKDVNLSPLGENQKSFQKEQNEIEKMEEARRKAERDRKAQETAAAQTASQLQQENQKVTQLGQDIQAAESSMKRQQKNLGSRPKAIEREDSYTVEVARGGGIFGKIADFFAGPKIETRYRTVRDDSAGKKWDDQNARIQREGLSKIDSLKRQRSTSQRAVETLQRKERENDRLLKQHIDEVKRLDKELDVARRELETLKAKATQEYLDLLKKNTSEQIKRYITDEMAKVSEQINHLVDQASTELTDWAIQRYRDELKRKIDWISEARKRESPALLHEVELLKNTVQTLSDIQSALRQRVG